jgi:hypothetical protein
MYVVVQEWLLAGWVVNIGWPGNADNSKKLAGVMLDLETHAAACYTVQRTE